MRFLFEFSSSNPSEPIRVAIFGGLRMDLHPPNIVIYDIEARFDDSGNSDPKENDAGNAKNKRKHGNHLLIELSKRCRLIPILGNHDEMMLRARESKSAFRDWWEWGAIETLDSYGESGRIELIPDGHFKFLESSVPWFESKTYFFVHANYNPDLPLDQQDERMLRWLSLRDYVPGPHVSGKIAVVGHTPQTEVFDRGHLICIDTGCAIGGKLTAMEMGSGEVWQAGTMQS